MKGLNMLFNKKNRMGVSLIVCVALLLANVTVSFAQKKVFIREYIYNASEIDSKVSSRTIALEQVKRALLEELGTYLESKTVIKNMNMTIEQITTLSVGIVSTNIVEEKWDGETYWLRARIEADAEEVAKSLEKLRADQDKVKVLEQSRKEAEEANKEIERLRTELEKLKTEKTSIKKTAKLSEEYDNAINKLSATDWFERAIIHSDAGEHDNALSALNMAIKLYPSYVYAYHNRGTTFYRLKQYNKAIEDLTQAIKMNSTFILAIYNRGTLYFELQEYNKALEDFGAIISMKPKRKNTAGIFVNDPNLMRAYVQRGRIYDGLGEYDKAINDYDTALSIDTPKYTYFFFRGMAFYSLKKYELAALDFDKAAKLSPGDNGTALALKGSSLIPLQRYKEAIESIEESITLGSSSYFTYLERCKAYSGLKLYNKVISDCSYAIEFKPYNSDAYVIRSVAYEMLGKTNEAIRDQQTAARLGNLKIQEILNKAGIGW